MISIFICMPYGDHNDIETRLANVNAAMDVWHRLNYVGFLPYCPHLSHFLHERLPRPRQTWLQNGLLWVQRCDALLAIGDTPGMLVEIRRARDCDKPVFTSIEALADAYGVTL